MRDQKGLSLIVIALFIALGIGGYLVYQNQPKPIIPPQQTPNNANEELTKYEKMTMAGYTELQRIPSPDGQYIAIKGVVPDINVITIKREGKILYENIIEPNMDSIFKNMERLGLKGRGQIGYSVKEWKNNTVFILQISPASGDEFETEVDVKTGKINESTFKRVK